LSWSLSWYKTIFKSFWSNEKYFFRMSVSTLRTFFRLAFKSSTPPHGLSGTPHCSCLVSTYFLMSSIILVWYLPNHLTISLCCKEVPYHAGYHVSKIAFRAKAFLPSYHQKEWTNARSFVTPTSYRFYLSCNSPYKILIPNIGGSLTKATGKV
jgi:hypothetical protein